MGIDFLGLYSAIIVPLTFFAWFFSLGITKFLSTYRLTLPISSDHIRCFGGTVLLTNIFIGILLLLYFRAKGFDENSVLIKCLFLYILLTVNIVIFAFLIREERYVYQIISQFLSFFIILILIVFLGYEDLSRLIFILVIGNLIVPIINVRYTGVVLKSLFSQSVQRFRSNLKILCSSFMAESSSYLLMRADILALNVFSSNMKLIGVFYFFSQIQGGLLNIAKAYEPILIREKSMVIKDKLKLIAICIAQSSLLAVISLLLWNIWAVRFSEEFLEYKHVYGVWVIAMLCMVSYLLLRSLYYSMEKYKHVAIFNSIVSSCFIAVVYSYFFRNGESLIDLVIVKAVVFFCLIVGFALVLKKILLTKSTSIVK